MKLNKRFENLSNTVEAYEMRKYCACAGKCNCACPAGTNASTRSKSGYKKDPMNKANIYKL